MGHFQKAKSEPNSASVPQKRTWWRKLWEQKLLFLMLLPLLLAVFVFRYLPMTGWLMAFKDYQLGMNIWDADWAGLDYRVQREGSQTD